jgi:hypothetical protein
MDQAMSALFGQVVELGIIVVIVVVVATWFRLFFLPGFKGKMGEAGINFFLKHALDQSV